MFYLVESDGLDRLEVFLYDDQMAGTTDGIDTACGTVDDDIAEVIIAKQRNGPIGTVELVWLPEKTKFANKAKS